MKRGWYPDSSWDYDPMLAMANAEIGGTLIAFSIAGLKTLIDRVFSKLDGLRCSHPRSSTALGPSAIFALDHKNNIVTIDGRDALQSRKTWLGLGAADNHRNEVDVDIPNTIHKVAEPSHPESL